MPATAGTRPMPSSRPRLRRRTLPHDPRHLYFLARAARGPAGFHRARGLLADLYPLHRRHSGLRHFASHGRGRGQLSLARRALFYPGGQLDELGRHHQPHLRHRGGDRGLDPRRARARQYRGLGDFCRHVGYGHCRCRRARHHRNQGHKDHGYSTEFSVGVTAAASTLGPIIPPSLPFVIYGMMANVSIGALFLGGVVPGAVMTIFMMAYVTYCARKYNMGRDQAFSLRILGASFVAALPALLTPMIIIGGMTFGWFTPTEAAIAACAWAIILGLFLYRSLTFKQFYKVTLDTIETTAAVLLIVAAASLFGWVLTTTRLTEYAADALLSFTTK